MFSTELINYTTNKYQINNPYQLINLVYYSLYSLYRSLKEPDIKKKHIIRSSNILDHVNRSKYGTYQSYNIHWKVPFKEISEFIELNSTKDIYLHIEHLDYLKNGDVYHVRLVHKNKFSSKFTYYKSALMPNIQIVDGFFINGYDGRLFNLINPPFYISTESERVYRVPFARSKTYITSRTKNVSNLTPKDWNLFKQHKIHELVKKYPITCKIKKYNYSLNYEPMIISEVEFFNRDPIVWHQHGNIKVKIAGNSKPTYDIPYMDISIYKSPLKEYGASVTVFNNTIINYTDRTKSGSFTSKILKLFGFGKARDDLPSINRIEREVHDRLKINKTPDQSRITSVYLDNIKFDFQNNLVYKIAEVPLGFSYRQTKCVVAMRLPPNARIAYDGSGLKFRTDRVIPQHVYIPIYGKLHEINVPYANSCCFGGHSGYFRYTRNQECYEPKFNPDLNTVCVVGLHFGLKIEDLIGSYATDEIKNAFKNGIVHLPPSFNPEYSVPIPSAPIILEDDHQAVSVATLQRPIYEEIQKSIPSPPAYEELIETPTSPNQLPEPLVPEHSVIDMPPVPTHEPTPTPTPPKKEEPTPTPTI